MVRLINQRGIQCGLFNNTLYYIVVHENNHGFFRAF